MSADEIVKALRDCAQDLLDVKGGTRKSAFIMVEASSLIENLQKQLAYAQRRADAAVRDLRRNRKYKCDCCHYANKQGQYIPCRDCQSPISNHGDLWQWRGPKKDCKTCIYLGGTCAGMTADENFDCRNWRGPQAEEGEKL
ncbi:MAG TPA: hypothetical protein DEA44_16785 [Firmicutes bacterium]|nr:hypothetical protein [Bacillota bacterium]